MRGAWLVVAFLVGCGPGIAEDTGCSDWDDDGVCDEDDRCSHRDDDRDKDGDGVPNVLEEDLLHEFRIPKVIFDTTSDEVIFVLGYGTEGQAHTEWVTLEPPFVLDFGGPWTETMHTCDLIWWSRVEEHLVGEEHDDLVGIWMEGTADGEGRLQLWQEPTLDIEVLEGARINWITLTVDPWERAEDSSAIGTVWSFAGNAR